MHHTHSLATLNTILAFYPPHERSQAIKEKDIYGQTLLQSIAERNNTKYVHAILEYYSPQDRVAACYSIMADTIHHQRSESLAALMHCLSGINYTSEPVFHALKTADAKNRDEIANNPILKEHCQSKGIDLPYLANLATQMQKQEAQRLRRKLFIIIAAIVLTPLSLFITIPLWYLAKTRDPLQELTTSKEKYQQVKDKRKALKGNVAQVADIAKPKKVILAQKNNKITYLVDREQLRRFTMFANPRKSKSCTLEALNESKQKSVEWKRSLLKI